MTFSLPFSYINVKLIHKWSENGYEMSTLLATLTEMAYVNERHKTILLMFRNHFKSVLMTFFST